MLPTLPLRSATLLSVNTQLPILIPFILNPHGQNECLTAKQNTDGPLPGELSRWMLSPSLWNFWLLNSLVLCCFGDFHD